MKRSAALTQLSREHHTALVLAKHAQRMSMENKGAVLRFMAQAVETFSRELEPHFRSEENTLLPALKGVGEPEIVRRTLTEHEELRRLANQLKTEDTTSLRRFGEALEAHVRFEERELFVLAESVLTPEALTILQMHKTTGV
ncbi:MAG: hemerythrin domain-containing protein [Sterolibacterium sp.]|nr:hemerythrin domain-containing protein [Sterolibacterium sp.]